jgi:hypothetical protein
MTESISFGGAGVLGFALGATYSGTLRQGQQLNVGDSLVSPNGRFQLIVQPDRNLVLNDGTNPLRAWSPGGTEKAVMQTDGNFVLYRSDGSPSWATDVRGHRLDLQDDGNLVLYYDEVLSGRGSNRNVAAWSSETNGPRVYEPSRGLFSKVTSAVGGALAPVAHLVTSPVSAAVHIAQGDNVLSTLGNHFKDQVKNIKDVAPMAQTVVSFVPGVGAGVNAAIAAGSAIAQGKPIDEALVAGVKNALPGGPLMARAFDAAWTVGKAAATGGNIGEAALTAAREQAIQQFGPAAGPAFDTGLALAHGQNVQQALTSGAVDLAKSQLASAASSAVTNALNALSPQVKNVATALLNQPHLTGLPVAQVAQALGADAATVTKATAALNTIKALTTLSAIKGLAPTSAKPTVPIPAPAKSVVPIPALAPKAIASALPKRVYSPYPAHA